MISLSVLAAQAAETEDSKTTNCLMKKNVSNDGWRLHPHEPNRLGVTLDESGKFMDFILSTKFAVLEDCFHRLHSGLSVLVTFTGRFGQYFDRHSSPVVGKRFNVEPVVLRYQYADPKQHDSEKEKKSVYLEIAYTHESNGQQITDLASYQQLQSTLDKPEHADDYISRGWDFVRFTLTSPEYFPTGACHPLQFRFTGKRFQKHGLQGTPEEYNSWENDQEGKRRKSVDGLTAGLRYQVETKRLVFTEFSMDVSHTTGWSEPFRYNTVRIEGGASIVDVPVKLWWAHGYNVDLARYYNKTRAFGIAIVIEK